MTFSEKLKILRAEKHLTQKEVAEILGVPKRTYEDWEYGKRTPTEFTQTSIIHKMEDINMEMFEKRTPWMSDKVCGEYYRLNLDSLEEFAEKFKNDNGYSSYVITDKQFERIPDVFFISCKIDNKPSTAIGFFK